MINGADQFPVSASTREPIHDASRTITCAPVKQTANEVRPPRPEKLCLPFDQWQGLASGLNSGLTMKMSAVRGIGGKILIYSAAGLIGLVVVLGGAVYAWVGHHLPMHSGTHALTERVVIANLVYTGSCPVIAAQANGYFADEGIEADVPVYASGKAALDAMFSGKADLAVSGDLPTMFAVMNHQPLTVIASVARAENDLGIVGRKDKGITTPASLRGKRIGITAGTGSHFVLDVFLTRQRLSVKDVTVLDLQPEALSDALARGDIDAASTWEPVLGGLKARLGANDTTFLAGDIYHATLNLSGTRTYVASHARTLQKVLRALIPGARFCADHPDEARALVAAAFKAEPAGLAASWHEYRFRVTLDQSLLLELEDETRWAVRSRLTARSDMPNYLNHVSLDALDAVAPAMVTVIH